MSIFVDNIKIIRAKNSKVISYIKKKLIAIFKIIDIRPISFYLRFKVS